MCSFIARSEDVLTRTIWITSLLLRDQTRLIFLKEAAYAASFSVFATSVAVFMCLRYLHVHRTAYILSLHACRILQVVYSLQQGYECIVLPKSCYCL